eukprot:31209-Pelagococcus_subviridis.AAC.4
MRRTESPPPPGPGGGVGRRRRAGTAGRRLRTCADPDPAAAAASRSRVSTATARALASSPPPPLARAFGPTLGWFDFNPSASARFIASHASCTASPSASSSPGWNANRSYGRLVWFATAAGSRSGRSSTAPAARSAVPAVRVVGGSPLPPPPPPPRGSSRPELNPSSPLRYRSQSSLSSVTRAICRERSRRRGGETRRARVRAPGGGVRAPRAHREPRQDGREVCREAAPAAAVARGSRGRRDAARRDISGRRRARRETRRRGRRDVRRRRRRGVVARARRRRRVGARAGRDREDGARLQRGGDGERSRSRRRVARARRRRRKGARAGALPRDAAPGKPPEECAVDDRVRGAHGDARAPGRDARGASHTLVPVRPRWRGERRSLRTFPPGVSLRPGSLAFNPRPRSLSTPSDAFQLQSRAVRKEAITCCGLLCVVNGAKPSAECVKILRAALAKDAATVKCAAAKALGDLALIFGPATLDALNGGDGNGAAGAEDSSDFDGDDDDAAAPLERAFLSALDDADAAVDAAAVAAAEERYSSNPSLGDDDLGVDVSGGKIAAEAEAESCVGTAAAEALAKLCLRRGAAAFASAPAVVSKLLRTYFAVDARSRPRLAQCLAVFFPALASGPEDRRRLVSDAALPTLRAAAKQKGVAKVANYLVHLLTACAPVVEMAASIAATAAVSDDVTEDTTSTSASAKTAPGQVRRVLLHTGSHTTPIAW